MIRIVVVAGFSDLRAGILDGEIVVARGSTHEATAARILEALRSVRHPEYPARN